MALVAPWDRVASAMSATSPAHLWRAHAAEFRNPAQIVGQWTDAGAVDHSLLLHRTRGRWWETLAEADVTLLISREYEHLLIAATVVQGAPRLTHFRLPHPSGITVNRNSGVVHVASTRNPNQVYDFKAVDSVVDRPDVGGTEVGLRPLIPARSAFYPGYLYMHDLAIVGTRLYANSVGQNAVVRLESDGRFTRAWWPRAIETEEGPYFDRNHLQLNSIAAGRTLRDSFFSASTDRMSRRRPGHKNFPVDRRGVIFSGETREVAVRGLTRPHSARLWEGRVWVDNSGYGQVGWGEDGRFRPAFDLPGWTRGLCFHGDLAFVGTSRVIPQFSQYAPGLSVDDSTCAVHALHLPTGRVLGSLHWPNGNQIFAIEWIPSRWSSGFPFGYRSRARAEREKALFYGFSMHNTQDLDRLEGDAHP